MPELWLRKIFQKTVFVNTNLPENRVRMTKTQEELDELDDDSVDIFKSNIIERYIIRPTSVPIVDNMCLAEFAAYYYKDYKIDCETKDAQPDLLTDELIENQSTINTMQGLPKTIMLLNKNEHMKCRKVKAVLRYHTPNKRKEPELYFHHLLVLYYPWRDENNLIAADQTYTSKFYEAGVQKILEHNRSIFERDADAISEAFEVLKSNQNNIRHSFDSMNDQQNADLLGEMPDDLNADESFNEQLASHLDQGQCNNHAYFYIWSHHNLQPTNRDV